MIDPSLDGPAAGSGQTARYGDARAAQDTRHVRLAKLYASRRDIQGTGSGGFFVKSVTWGHYAGHLQGLLNLTFVNHDIDGGGWL